MVKKHTQIYIYIQNKIVKLNMKSFVCHNMFKKYNCKTI